MKKFGTTFLMVCSILMFFDCRKDTDYIIEYSTTGCFGDCPKLDIKLIGNKAYYNFIKYNKKEGLFYYKVSQEQQNKINKLITQILKEDIREEYLGDAVDIPATYFRLSRGDDILLKTNYDNNIAPNSLESLYSYLLGISETGLIPAETKSIDFSTREEIGIDTFSPPPPPKKINE